MYHDLSRWNKALLLIEFTRSQVWLGFSKMLKKERKKSTFDSEKQKLNENVLRKLFLCFVAQTWKLKQFLTKITWVQVIVNPESGT